MASLGARAGALEFVVVGGDDADDDSLMLAFGEGGDDVDLSIEGESESKDNEEYNRVTGMHGRSMALPPVDESSSVGDDADDSLMAAADFVATGDDDAASVGDDDAASVGDADAGSVDPMLRVPLSTTIPGFRGALDDEQEEVRKAVSPEPTTSPSSAAAEASARGIVADDATVDGDDAVDDGSVDDADEVLEITVDGRVKPKRKRVRKKSKRWQTMLQRLSKMMNVPYVNTGDDSATGQSSAMLTLPLSKSYSRKTIEAALAHDPARLARVAAFCKWTDKPEWLDDRLMMAIADSNVKKFKALLAANSETTDDEDSAAATRWKIDVGPNVLMQAIVSQHGVTMLDSLLRSHRSLFAGCNPYEIADWMLTDRRLLPKMFALVDDLKVLFGFEVLDEALRDAFLDRWEMFVVARAPQLARVWLTRHSTTRPLLAAFKFERLMDLDEVMRLVATVAWSVEMEKFLDRFTIPVDRWALFMFRTGGEPPHFDAEQGAILALLKEKLPAYLRSKGIYEPVRRVLHGMQRDFRWLSWDWAKEVKQDFWNDT